MTLDDARAHIGKPVLARDHSSAREGEIVSVDEVAGQVRLRLRRKTAPYDFLPHTSPGWHPSRLAIPDWWLREQERAER